jgi:transcriptional regulator GlxA family with amidase domain
MSKPNSPRQISIDLLASESVSASSLYGLYDVLTSVGIGWETFVTGAPRTSRFRVRIVSTRKRPFKCASGVQVLPNLSIDEADGADVVVVPGLTVPATKPLDKSHVPMCDWLDASHRAGARITAACTGALILAETGLLDGLEATTHWAFRDHFRLYYPRVRLRLEKNLCCSDARPEIVTSGGAGAWQELALFLITQYAGIEQAVRASKFWLLPDQGSLQAPYMAMPLAIPHSDAAVRNSQVWVAQNYAAPNPVATMIARSDLPAATFARRFKRATGYVPMDYVHTVRTEEAKQMLETTDASVESIGEEVGYGDPASFRRLFKRKSGLTPAEYRRLFGGRRFERYRSVDGTAD